jgi:hypothetical protein
MYIYIYVCVCVRVCMYVCQTIYRRNMLQVQAKVRRRLLPDRGAIDTRLHLAGEQKGPGSSCQHAIVKGTRTERYTGAMST